jgi:putative ABC transport system substrate-binding protein
MRSQIVEFAREKALPAIYEAREFVEAGGLMSYGHNVPAMFRRAAYYMDPSSRGPSPPTCRSNSRARSSLRSSSGFAARR